MPQDQTDQTHHRNGDEHPLQEGMVAVAVAVAVAVEEAGAGLEHQDQVLEQH